MLKLANEILENLREDAEAGPVAQSPCFAEKRGGRSNKRGGPGWWKRKNP
jgi:hypothetical protein